MSVHHVIEQDLDFHDIHQDVDYHVVNQDGDFQVLRRSGRPLSAVSCIKSYSLKQETAKVMQYLNSIWYENDTISLISALVIYRFYSYLFTEDQAQIPFLSFNKLATAYSCLHTITLISAGHVTHYLLLTSLSKDPAGWLH
jgi:hypothetical protein